MLRVPKVTASCTTIILSSSNGVASKCYRLTPITLPLIPTVQAKAVHGSATIDEGREERPPPSETRQEYPPSGHLVPSRHRCPLRPSSLPAPGTPSRYRPPALPPPSSSRPVRSLVHPALYLPAPIVVLLAPRQGFCEPPLASNINDNMF